MKMIGIIFSDIYNSEMGELTKQRTLASVPFGGRYRLVDFVLSNMANSGFESIGIITRYNYQSLMDHLGSCEEWDLNRKTRPCVHSSAVRHRSDQRVARETPGTGRCADVFGTCEG